MLRSLNLKDKFEKLLHYQDAITEQSHRFSEICKTACETLNGKYVGIGFVDDQKSWSPIWHGTVSEELPREQSFAAEVLEKKITIVVPNVDRKTDLQRRYALKSRHIRSYICVPIIAQTIFVGTFFITFDKPKNFEDKDISLMEGLVRIIISMLDTSFLNFQNAQQLSDTGTLLNKVNSQQLKLSRNDKILKHVSRLANIGGWEYDLTDQSIHWSDQVYEIHEMILGTTIEIDTALNFYPPEERAMVAQNLRHTIETGDSFEFECCITTALGNVRKVRSLGEPEYENDRVVRVFGTFQDITEQRMIETQARQFLKMETLGQLTSEISHDFNNILSSIIGNLQLYLKRQQHLASGSQEVADALQSAHRGVKLTNRLLNFSRSKNLFIEAFKPSTVTLGLAELMQEACGSNIKLILEIESNCGSVASDISLFETSLLNLVINARDASPVNSEITVCVQSLGGNSVCCNGKIGSIPTEYISISVSDNGMGIPQSILKRITEPFFTTKEPGKGTGLGLSAVNNLVTQSGGQLNIDSLEGKGTTVIILLPLLNQQSHLQDQYIQVH